MEDAFDEFENDSPDVGSHLQTVVEETEEEFVPEQSSKTAKKHECIYCDYTAPYLHLLNRHLKSHSEERPFECSDCNSCFKTPAALLQHTNTHLSKKPHECKHCERTFASSGELVRHTRYKHAKVGSHPHK